jgi:hypothetical protein
VIEMSDNPSEILHISRSEISEIATVSEAEKERELEEKKVETTSKNLQQTLHVQQVFSIFLTMTIITVFNFVKFISLSLTDYVMTNNYMMNLSDMVSFLINMILIFVLILVLMYFPKLTQKTIQKFSIGLAGILSGLVIIILSLFYVKDRVLMLFRGESFYFFNLSLFLPFLILVNGFMIKNKESLYHANIFFYMLVLFLTLIILDYPHANALWSFIQQNVALTIFILGFTIVSGIYIGLAFKIKVTTNNKAKKILHF